MILSFLLNVAYVTFYNFHKIHYHIVSEEKIIRIRREKRKGQESKNKVSFCISGVEEARKKMKSFQSS